MIAKSCVLPSPSRPPSIFHGLCPLTSRVAARAFSREEKVSTSDKSPIEDVSLPFPLRVTKMRRLSYNRTSSKTLASGTGQYSIETFTEELYAPNSPELLPDAGIRLHFAYGQGLHFDTLRSNRIKVLSRDGCFVRDGRVALVFRHRGGKATLQSLGQGEQPKYMPFGDRVHGVLYQMTKEDLERLAASKEGYQLSEIEVELYDGRTAHAMVFVSKPMELLPREVVPPEGYMKLLREGSADQIIDPVYQAWLSSIDTVCGAGLGPEYFNTPSQLMLQGLFCMVGVSLMVGASHFLTSM